MAESDTSIQDRALPSPFPAEWASDWGEDLYGLWMSLSISDIRQTFRWIEPGEFMMGSPETEPNRESNELQHRVMISKGYWLADTTCVQALWAAIADTQPSRFEGADNPVDSVSWQDVNEWIGRFNELVVGLDVRLPTEAEWEYACRAGTTTPFSFGGNLAADMANIGDDIGSAVSVKSYLPNAWGLYEMHGNVWEWCSDADGPYPTGVVTDPIVGEGDGRVLRGGGWFSPAGSARSACRVAFPPDFAYGDIGFRLARGQ